MKTLKLLDRIRSLRVSTRRRVAPGVPGYLSRARPLLAASVLRRLFLRRIRSTAASTLPYQAPPFDKIQDTDYQPASKPAWRSRLPKSTQSPIRRPLPTFDNTISQLERSGALLTRVHKVFNAITAANTNDTLQQFRRCSRLSWLATAMRSISTTSCISE